MGKRWKKLFIQKLLSDKNRIDQQNGDLPFPTKRSGLLVSKISELGAILGLFQEWEQPREVSVLLKTEERHTKHPVLFNNLDDIYPST